MFFRVESVAGWAVPEGQRQLQFGEFWRGLLDENTTSPLVMGKLQGPRGLLGTPACSAGFMSVSGNAYYKWIFDAAARPCPL